MEGQMSKKLHEVLTLEQIDWIRRTYASSKKEGLIYNITIPGTSIILMTSVSTGEFALITNEYSHIYPDSVLEGYPNFDLASKWNRTSYTGVLPKFCTNLKDLHRIWAELREHYKHGRSEFGDFATGVNWLWEKDIISSTKVDTKESYLYTVSEIRYSLGLKEDEFGNSWPPSTLEIVDKKYPPEEKVLFTYEMLDEEG